MRVLFVSHPESNVIDLSAALNQLGVESQVIEGSGSNIETELRGLVRKFRPDVLQIEDRPDLVRSVRSCFSGQLVLSLHSLECLAGSKITRRELRVALCMIDKVITVSHDLKRLFLGRYYGLRSKTHVIYPGVDTAIFKPDYTNGLKLRKALGLNGQKVALFVGESATQGLNVILSAWSEIYCQTKACLLVKNLPSGVNPVPVGVFGLGDPSRDGLIASYQAADLFVFPSQGREVQVTLGFEALASGLPVVASMRGGIVEIIDNTCGLLVRQYADSTTWSRILVKLLQDDAHLQNLAAGALEKGRSFTWEKSAITLTEAYAI